MRVRGADAAAALLFACGSWYRIAAVAILPLCTAGCITAGLTGPATDVRGTTVAFDSVDGPPPPVAQTLMRDLNAEATARQIFVVDRNNQAMYRVRGYLATQAEPGGTSVAWAWDIYDADQRHVFRLRGADRTTGGRAWSAADEPTLRRIARASVDQLVAFLSAPHTAAGPPTEPATSQPRGWSILAGLDDFGPEAAGIFRVLSAAPVPWALDPPTEATPRDVPLPRNRPSPGGAPTAALAYADPGQ
jgi:hypothetical protein